MKATKIMAVVMAVLVIALDVTAYLSLSTHPDIILWPIYVMNVVVAWYILITVVLEFEEV